MAFIVAVLLYIKKKWITVESYFDFIIASFIAIGIFDGLHSLQAAGNTFVWFHSLAVFSGGFILSLVWLSDRKSPILRMLPLITLVSAFLTGMFSLAYKDSLPLMVLNGQFTSPAKALNIGGGFFFLVSAAWFIKRYLANKGLNELFFLNFSLLLGISGFLFHISELMDAYWWLLHWTSLAAFFSLFVFIAIDIKNTSMEISFSENYLKSIIENEPECVKLLDSHGRLIEMNASGLCMIEAENIEQVRGHQVYDIVAPEYREMFRDLTERVCKGESGTLRFRTIGLKGNERWLETKAVPFYDKKGDRPLLLGVTRDITDREKASIELNRQAEEIIDSERRYRNLFSSIRDVIVIADRDRRIMDVNQPALRDMFGYELAELAGKATSVLYADMEEFNAAGREVFDAHQRPIGKIMEISFKRKDGTIFPTELFAMKLMGDGGEITGNLGIIRDITERKKAQEAVSESRERLNLIIEKMPTGCILWNPDFEVELWNPAAGDIFGYTFDEATGKHAYDIIVDRDETPHVDDIWRRLISGDETPHSINDNVTKDGQTITCEWYNTPLKKDGKVIGVLSMVHDISARINAEQQIQSSLKEKEVLLREIHHRVKNNMTIISSLISLQANSVTDEKIKRVLLESQGRVRSMALVHEMLYQSNDLLKIDAHQYLSSLVDNLFGTYATSKEQVNFNISVENISLNIDTLIPCGLIVTELITNSLKYAFKNTGKGRIDLSVQRQGPETIVLEVSDNGVGIPEDYEFDKSTSLGLRLVSALTEQLEGSLERIESEGTSFRLTFNEQGSSEVHETTT